MLLIPSYTHKLFSSENRVAQGLPVPTYLGSLNFGGLFWWMVNDLFQYCICWVIGWAGAEDRTPPPSNHQRELKNEELLFWIVWRRRKIVRARTMNTFPSFSAAMLVSSQQHCYCPFMKIYLHLGLLSKWVASLLGYSSVAAPCY